MAEADRLSRARPCTSGRRGGRVNRKRGDQHRNSRPPGQRPPNAFVRPVALENTTLTVRSRVPQLRINRALRRWLNPPRPLRPGSPTRARAAAPSRAQSPTPPARRVPSAPWLPGVVPVVSGASQHRGVQGYDDSGPQRDRPSTYSRRQSAIDTDASLSAVRQSSKLLAQSSHDESGSRKVGEFVHLVCRSSSFNH